jgi:hypothetical protein
MSVCPSLDNLKTWKVGPHFQTSITNLENPARFCCGFVLYFQDLESGISKVGPHLQTFMTNLESQARFCCGFVLYFQDLESGISKVGPHLQTFMTNLEPKQGFVTVLSNAFKTWKAGFQNLDLTFRPP